MWKTDAANKSSCAMRIRTPAAISWLVDIIIEDIPIDIDENIQTIALAYSTDSFWWIVMT